jgi:hypothetical protein
MAAKIALGMKVKVLGKASFWWPLGPLLHKLGVIPLDRSSPQGTVGQAVDLLRNNEKMWFAITPEGTRKAVKEWKAGFLKIARMADVPILAAYFHYPEKTIGIGPLFSRPATMLPTWPPSASSTGRGSARPRHGLSRPQASHRRHVRHMPGERDRSRVEGWYSIPSAQGAFHVAYRSPGRRHQPGAGGLFRQGVHPRVRCPESPGQQPAEASTNPLLTASTLPFQAPQFDKIKDSDYLPAFEEGMRQHLAEIARSPTAASRPASTTPSWRWSAAARS